MNEALVPQAVTARAAPESVTSRTRRSDGAWVDAGGMDGRFHLRLRTDSGEIPEIDPRSVAGRTEGVHAPGRDSRVASCHPAPPGPSTDVSWAAAGSTRSLLERWRLSAGR